jgi:hypothetical protein
VPFRPALRFRSTYAQSFEEAVERGRKSPVIASLPSPDVPCRLCVIGEDLLLDQLLKLGPSRNPVKNEAVSA